MILVIGLGNPGPEFKNTRHNSGFLAVDFLQKQFAEKLDIKPWQYSKKFDSEISQGKIEGQKIILAKPQTFMNNSGKAVKSLAIFYKIKPKDIWLIHDDIDLTLGKLRLSFAAASAGHKGVESVISALKTKDIIRFRIGIGRPVGKTPVESYVLQKFGKEEEKIIKKTAAWAVEAIATALTKGIDKARNKYNN